MFANLWADLKQTCAANARRPATAVLAILVLSLGIGLTAAMFAILDKAAIRVAPYPDSSRIVTLWASVPKKGLERDWTSYPILMDWRDANKSLDDFAVHLRVVTATVVRDEPSRVNVGRVSASLFPLLGAATVFGRYFTPEEELQRQAVVVLSNAYWQQEFGGARDIIGKTLNVDGKQATIVGVIKSGFDFPSPDTQIWIPLTYIAQWPAYERARQADAFRAIAKLKPGVSIESARADLKVITERLGQKYPATDADKAANLTPIAEEMASPSVRRALWLMMIAVVLVFTVACWNVATLLLARDGSRRGEFAIRAALGANPSNLLNLVLSEAFVISLLGGLLGLLFAVGLLAAATAYAPPDLSGSKAFQLNPLVLFITFLAALASAVLSGLAPAWVASRTDPITAIRESGRAARGQAKPLLWKVLVTSQLAVTTLLALGAALMVLSYMRVQQVDLGFRPENLLLAPVELPGGFSGRGQSAANYFEQAMHAVAGIPGVEKVGAVSALFSPHGSNNTITVERASGSVAVENEPNRSSIVAGHYFEAMGIPVRSGRLFNEYDTDKTPPVAVLNHTMARRLWPGEDPVGKRFRFGVPGEPIGPWVTVAGTVGDTLPNGPESEVASHFYVPQQQRPNYGAMEVIVRTPLDNAQMMQQVGQTILAVNRSVPRFETTTVAARLRTLGHRRAMNTWLVAAFAGISASLASVGLYGLIHYSVSQRRAEIGVRMALGATPRAIAGMMLWEGLLLGLAGVTSGFLLAIVLMRWLSSFVYGVSLYELSAFGMVGGGILLIAVLASVVPAVTGARVQPAQVLASQ